MVDFCMLFLKSLFKMLFVIFFECWRYGIMVNVLKKILYYFFIKKEKIYCSFYNGDVYG